MGDGSVVDVLCLHPDSTEVGRRLAAATDRLAVRTATGEATAREAATDADCVVLVVTGPDALATLSWTETRPAVAFAAPDHAGAALTAGAEADRDLDVVTAAGPDRFAVLTDRITSAVEAGETAAELRETEARFEALTENTDFAIVTIDEDSVVRYASPAVESVFGYEPAALIGESLTAVMPDRFHERHHEAVGSYLATGERALDWGWIELPGERADGTEVPLGVSFGERRSPEGRLFSAVIRDMSERYERRERLDRMASALEGSMDGVGLLDESGRFDHVNDAHAEVYGYEPAELVGEHWRTLYDEREIERFEREVMPAVEETGRWRGEATGVRADGSTFPQELTLTELDDGGLVCVVRDVADRVDRRRQLESEREFVDTVIDTLPDAFYVVDTEWRFDRWNDRFAAATGYSDEQLDGMYALEVIPPEDRDAVAEAPSTVIDGGEAETVRSALLTAQGDRIPYVFSGNRVVDPDGSVVGLAGIGRDVTDRELRRQRLSVLSRVLRHNVRNRTTVIRGQTEHVRERLDEEGFREALGRVEAAATEIAQASDRARQAEQVLRDGETDRRPIDLVPVVERALAAFDPGEAALETALPERAPAVATDDVESAVVELLANARSHVDEATIRVRVERIGDAVEVVVADDGPGIPSHERRALADEVESPPSHSTGLGLWLVRWIVTVAGGTVSVREGELGGNAVVLVLLGGGVTQTRRSMAASNASTPSTSQTFVTTGRTTSSGSSPNR